MVKILNLETDTFYLQDEQSDLYYASISYHRDGTRLGQKSQWAISIDDEFDLFKSSFSEISGWFDNFKGWGLSCVKEDETYLISIVGEGITNEQLFFVKYIDGGKNNKWHGYPANYQRNIQDKPSTQFLTVIYNEGIITKPQFSKIKKGKKCSL